VTFWRGYIVYAPSKWQQLLLFVHDFVIICFAGLIKIGAAIQTHCSTSLPFAQLVFCNSIFGQLSLFFRF
jgi:hypothetical protein